MAEWTPPRFLPPRVPRRDFERAASIPRWFTREAVAAFGLNPFDYATFCIIADNLDGAGISLTATTLIADRGGMSRNSAEKSINSLISHRLLYELDPRKKGRMMRYVIPAEMPWGGVR